MKSQLLNKAPASRSRRKRVLVVDTFAISRMITSRWLGQTSDLAVCGEADSEASALKAVDRFRPDAVVTEVLRAEDMEIVRKLHRLNPALPILVYSFRHEENHAALALEAGADGYLMKGSTAEELVEGIRAAMSGRLVLSAEVRAKLLGKCVRSRHRIPALKNPRPCSSPKGASQRVSPRKMTFSGSDASSVFSREVPRSSSSFTDLRFMSLF